MVSWSCSEISCCVPNCTAPCFSPSISRNPPTFDFESSKCKVPSASNSVFSSSCCQRAHKHFLYSIALSSPRTQNPSPHLQSTTISKNEMTRTMSSHFTGFIAATSPPQSPPSLSHSTSTTPATSPISSPKSPSSTRLRSLSKLQIPQQRLLQPQQVQEQPSPLSLKPRSTNNTPSSNQQPTTATTSTPLSPSPSPFKLLTQHLLKVPQNTQQVSPLSTTYMPRSGTSISPMSGRSPHSTMGVLGSPFSGRTPFSSLTTGSMGMEGSPLALSNLSSPVLAV